MTTTDTIDNDLTRRLLAWNDGLGWVSGNARLMGVAIVELAGGEPVALARIAARSGRSEAEVREFLRGSPAEWDDRGRLVGFGLTQRRTRHRFITRGRTLYTWCAPDALAFPALTGEPALVESSCFVTGAPVRVEVAPDGVRAVDPPGAVVSIVPRDVAADELRERLCHEQHFFVSRAAAEAWRRERDDVIVAPVAEAFEPLRRLMQRWAPEPSQVAEMRSRAAASLVGLGLDELRAARAAALPLAEQRLFRRVLTAFAASEPPSADAVETWADQLGLDAATALPDLQSVDLIQLDAAGAIAVAYPFSARPTTHRVTLEDGPAVWAMCAIDALGIPFMLHRRVVISAAEPDGEAVIQVRVDPARDEVAAQPEGAVVLAARSGRGCSADCRCPYINLFTSAERAEEYRAGHPELTGEVLSLRDAVEVGRLHFGGLLEPARS